MKRRYKLLLIIFIGTIITIIINRHENVVDKISLVALGDGFSLGMTHYNVAGNSFNDYLKEKLENVDNLDSFNNDFSINHLTTHELNEYLLTNKIGNFSKLPIKQIIERADVVTIAIGIDEFAQKSLMENIGITQIDNYLNEFNNILNNIRNFYKKTIIVVGLYPAFKLSRNEAITINKKLNLLCGKYDTIFLDVIDLSLNDNYYLSKDSYQFNYLAHEKIAKKIYSIIKQ